MLGGRVWRQVSQRILLTGAGGNIGQDMILYLQQKYGSGNVMATDSSLRKFKWPSNTLFKKLDVMDDVAVDNLAAEFHPTRIFHFASIFTESEQDPQKALKVNMEGVKNMLEVAKKYHCSVFFPSTIGAFGPGTPQVPTNLEIMRPITIYGITNIHMELLGEYYNRRYNVDMRSARVPIVNSWQDVSGGTSDFTVNVFYDLFRTNKAVIPVWEDVKMPLIYLPDVLRSLDDLMETPNEKLTARVYTMACVSTSAKDYGDQLLKLFPGAEITYEPDYRDELVRTWPTATDASVAQRDWGHHLTYDLPAMLKDMYLKIKAKLGK